MSTYRQIAEESLFFRREQITKYTHVYSITLEVMNPSGTANNAAFNVEAVLQIMEDADFHITHLLGSVTDPPLDRSSTDLGIQYPQAYAVNRAERGIWFKFQDPKTNRPLQLGIPTQNAVNVASQFLTNYDHTMVEFNSVFGPGYGNKWGKPVPFDYTLLRGERLKVQLQNRNTIPAEIGSEAYCIVSMSFIGHRYEN